jgi:transcriptional regulator with XRE-family HTH domain
MPFRIGKAVTQEEVAEAVGISRLWYCTLESGRLVRASAPLLARVADVLMLDSAERASLFRLGVPELRSSTFQQRSRDVLDAFRSLRSLTRQLWTASSEVEALTIVREFGATHFASDLMVSTVRAEPSGWEDLTALGAADTCHRLNVVHTFLRETCAPPVIEELNFSTALAQPGDVLVLSEQPPPSRALSRQFGKAVKAVGWPAVDFLLANVRSRSGFVAHVAVVHTGHHAYSEADRAQLSTIAELTSLALSDPSPA